jgi:hypothetical protein
MVILMAILTALERWRLRRRPEASQTEIQMVRQKAHSKE